MNRLNTMKIVQLNAQRSVVVMNELRDYMLRHGIDVVLLQELYYQYKGKVKGLGLGARIHHGQGREESIQACDVLGPHFEHDAFKLGHHSDTHQTAVHIQLQNDDVYQVNCQLSQDIQHHIYKLDYALTQLHEEEMNSPKPRNCISEVRM